jgi:hypothetical protein
VSDNSDGTFSYPTVSWNAAEPFVDVYTPHSPGHKVISTTIDSTTGIDFPVNTAMDNMTYSSYGADSLNGFIYVMADTMTISGNNDVNGGTTHTYTLTMNGPFVGTILLSDVLANGYTSAGGHSPTNLARLLWQIITITPMSDKPTPDTQLAPLTTRQFLQLPPNAPSL